MTRKIKTAAGLTLACAALFTCLSLSSCSRVVKADETENGFVIDTKDSDIGYILCNRSVYAVTMGEVYAKDGNGNKYCTVKFEDPERFLCDNDEELPRVYRAEGVEDVTIDNFNPIAAALYLEGEISLYVDFLYAEPEYQETSAPEGTVAADDSEYTYAIRDAMTDSEVVRDTAPTLDEMDADFTVHIRLLSADYPGLYYEVVFWRDNNGINYLYDIGSGNSFLCPYAVTERLWGGET